MTTALFHTGQRLSYDKQLCTVRFVGELPGTSGQWLGLEWDDASRGKHDGQHKGIRYFECASKQPTPASFVRPTRPRDPPRTFTEAVRKKYAYDDDTEGLGLKPVFISGKEAEEVGFDKIRMQMANLNSLRVVIVDGLCVQRHNARQAHEESSDVQETCPKITDLDLSRNLFEEWEEVVDIARQLRSLQSLKVEGNRFCRINTSFGQSLFTRAPFTKLQTLSFDDTLLSWSDVCTASAMFSSLASLSASGNEYSALVSLDLPRTITSLSLERNNFTSLAQLPLDSLPNLQKLSLKSNSIGDASSPPFADSIQWLDMSYNQITHWSFIDSIPVLFPGLSFLRIAHNPLFDTLRGPDGRTLSADDGYMLTIARLGKIQTLNYSKISSKERLNAETYYLSMVAKQIAAEPVRAEEIKKENPRFDELCEVYGDPMVKADSQTRQVTKGLAAKLVKLRVKVQPDVGQQGELMMELPKSLTVYAALGVIGRRLNCAPMLLKLVWETDEAVPTGDAEDDEQGEAGSSEPALREDVLVPRSRQLHTWIEGNEATVRVEWSEQEVKRSRSFQRAAQ